jgi:hypothetical protein
MKGFTNDALPKEEFWSGTIPVGVSNPVPGGIGNRETARTYAQPTGVMNSDPPDIVVGQEEWLTGKKRDPPRIGQPWRNVVRNVGKVRSKIGLPVSDGLRGNNVRDEQKSE